MNVQPSGNSTVSHHVASGSVSVISTPVPNPFETLWRDVGHDAAESCSPKKTTPRKRLFAKFFQRQNKDKKTSSKSTEVPPFNPLPSHTSVSSASSGFPRALVETSYHAGSGSRSIASGSIYTSMSYATNDTRRKEMTTDSLLRGAQEVLGTLSQQSQQQDLRQARTNQQRLSAPSSTPIVGSTIFIAPKTDKSESVKSSEHRMQHQSREPVEYSLQANSMSPPRIRRNHTRTPLGNTHQATTPAAPMRYQEHTTLFLSSPQRQAPSSLQLGGYPTDFNLPMQGNPIPPPPVLRTNHHCPAFSPLVLPQASIEDVNGVSVPRRGTLEMGDYMTPSALNGQICRSCGARSYCIQHAEYIRCPHCGAVGKLAGSAMAGDVAAGGEVVLGLTEGQWIEWNAKSASFA